MSTLIHDVLMIPRRSGDEQRARETHAADALQFLMPRLALLNLTRHEAIQIADIVRAHGLTDFAELPTSVALGSDVVDVRKLGACFPMADICHADESRAPQIVYDYLTLDPESESHWRRHLSIGGIARINDELLISAYAFSPDGGKDLAKTMLVRSALSCQS